MVMQQEPRRKRYCFSPLESSRLWVIKCNHTQPAKCSSPSSLSQPTPTIRKQTRIQTKVPKMTSSRGAPTNTCAVLAVLCWFVKWGSQRTGNAVLVYYDIFTAGRKTSFRIWVCKELFWTAVDTSQQTCVQWGGVNSFPAAQLVPQF